MADAQTDAWNEWGNRVMNSGATGIFNADGDTLTAPASISRIPVIPPTAPAPFTRISSIPDWMPRLNTSELEAQYRGVNPAFDTSRYDAAAKEQEARTLSTGLNAGRNAAAEYTNKARQMGGSGMGAGLVKAEAQVGARKAAGDLALQREKFDADQRSAAGIQAATIAKTLGELRQNYLSSLVSYATSEDSTAATVNRTATDFELGKYSTAATYSSNIYGADARSRG